jgi:hypothetical protein
MKFVILMSEAGEAWAKLSPREQADVLERHAEFQRALESAGKYVMSKRLAPASQARTVRRASDGRISFSDGPFAETKEVIGGFYIIEAASLEEAVAWAERARFITGWNEVRALAED